MSEVFYWDSGVFIAHFGAEKGRVDTVRSILKEADSGNVRIITSSLTLVEVLKLKGHEPIREEDERKLVDFFKHDFIRIMDVTRAIAEHARHLVWRLPGMKPKDSVHLASALAYSRRANLDALHSYDGDFLNLNGRTDVPLLITQPFLHAPFLPFTTDPADGQKAN